jgi:D-hydroxyproline dehydrogenase subunit beta
VRVVVIGAGIVGASVARALAVAGDSVTIVEAGAPGQGTTSTSFAWVNANSKEPENYYALNLAGMQAHRRLAAATGAVPVPWFFPTGNLEWCTDDKGEERLHERVDRLKERGYSVAWVTADQARELEPDLLVPGDVRAIAYFADEGHCQPMVLLSRLLGEALDMGAQLRTHTGVRGIDTHPEGANVRVETRHPAESMEAEATGAMSEETLAADAVVSCVGRWSSQLLGPDRVPMLGPGRSEASTLGFIAVTAPVPTRLSRIISTPELNVRPDGAGRLLLQALTLDPQQTPTPLPDEHSRVAEEMVERLGTLLRGTGDTRVDRLHLGRRAMPADGHTVCGWLDDRLYAVATHSGITLAPLLGDLVARELHDERIDQLEPFRPDRFGSAVTTAEPQQPRGVGEQ